MTTAVAPEVTKATSAPILRHIVELNADGTPKDKCLCGHIWDRVFITDGPLCDECRKIAEEIVKGRTEI